MVYEVMMTLGVAREGLQTHLISSHLITSEHAPAELMIPFQHLRNVLAQWTGCAQNSPKFTPRYGASTEAPRAHNAPLS